MTKNYFKQCQALRKRTYYAITKTKQRMSFED